MTEPNAPTDEHPPTGPDPDELPNEPPDVDELDLFEADPAAYEDLDEFVNTEWGETKTGRQRVKDVISRASRPLSVANVAELTAVSKPTARKELNELEAEGVVRGEDTANGRLYQRDPDWYRIKRIRTLSERDPGHLEKTLQRLEREVEGYKETYRKDDPEEVILSDTALSDEAWEDISYWRTAIVDIEYLRTALRYRRLKRCEDHTHSEGKNIFKNLNTV